MLIERRGGYRVSPFRVLEIKFVSQDNDPNLTPSARVRAFDSRSGRVRVRNQWKRQREKQEVPGQG